MTLSRYIVGIDLGTTNSAVAYIDTQASDLEAPQIQTFSIPQLVAEETVSARPTLPSFLYLPGEHDLPKSSLALPWDPERSYVVGEFARTQGARVPGRLISSAKSWLCHSRVDRIAPILPWGAADGVAKLSPVETSARYLLHIREAWDQTMGRNYPLDLQEVVLTVPASFDEVARELTVEAAQKAGLKRIALLEEPQAAFYAWLTRHIQTWQLELEQKQLILVCDVGGGTTDLSLIVAKEDRGKLKLERLAVGDHLLLGGDNMDMALARQVEARLTGSGKMDTQRWHLLCNLCRAAKEELFAHPTRAQVAVHLPGRGSAVVGGTLSEALTQEEVERIVLDGFFPPISASDLPRRGTRTGIQEWGLPYAAEPEITRHLAAFLKSHAQIAAGTGSTNGAVPMAQPQTVLFNGGALKPAAIRQRLVQVIGSWFQGAEEKSSWQPAVLENEDLDLAVAHGAAYYGLVRQGFGVRIGGGSARAYYIGIAGLQQTPPDIKEPLAALCLVRHGMEEGEEITVREPEFEVMANQPVSFPLYASSSRMGDRPGEVIVVEREDLAPLPPIRTVLRFGKKLSAVTLPVLVSARFTEVGTLELWCVSHKTPHRWRLQFQLRGEKHGSGQSRQKSIPTAATQVEERVIDEPLLEEAFRLIRSVYQPSTPSLTQSGADPITLVRILEQTLGYRKDSWPLTAIRRLWDALWEIEEQRARGAEYEARWLNLIGFCLRPGFGHPTDDWRIQQLWKIFPAGVRFANAVQCRAEWWSLWKRVAGGLNRAQQTHLYNEIAPWLLPHLKAKITTGRSKVGQQETREMWQVMGSCERLPAEAKAELGKVLARSLEKGKASDQEIWAFTRLGARTPLYGPLNCVVRKNVVEDWIERLLGVEWRKPEATAFALVQLARCVGDRERDLDEGLRQRLAERVSDFPSKARWTKLLLEAVPLKVEEQARILDEPLPAGLRIRES
jgi:molecular chaperone DnaK (HSP70)